MTTITDAEREAAIEIAAEGIMDRMDIDTGSEEWAEGAVDALLSLGWRPAPVVDDAMVERAAAAWIASTRNFGPLSLDGWDRTMRETIRDAITEATRAALLAALTPET